MPGEEKTKEEIEKNLGIKSRDLEKIYPRKPSAEKLFQPEKEVLPEKSMEINQEDKLGLKLETPAKEGRENEGVAIDQGVQVRNKRIKEIEAVLEEDLEDIYSKMPVNKQKEFKIEGEKVSGNIFELISASKVKINKIIDLIRKWLSIIPGVNKFFLEQETKIKTDKIIKLRSK